jgi:hypothetical protein
MYIRGARIEHGGKCFKFSMGIIVSISQTIQLYLQTTEILSLCLFVSFYTFSQQYFIHIGG